MEKGPEAFLKNFRLTHPQRRMQSRKLTVQIRWLHHICIHNRHTPYSRATNHFRRIRSYSTQAYY